MHCSAQCTGMFFFDSAVWIFTWAYFAPLPYQNIPWLNHGFGYGSTMVNYGKTIWLTVINHGQARREWEGKLFPCPATFGGSRHRSKILKRVFQASFWPQKCTKYIFGRGFAPDDCVTDLLAYIRSTYKSLAMLILTVASCFFITIAWVAFLFCTNIDWGTL